MKTKFKCLHDKGTKGTCDRLKLKVNKKGKLVITIKDFEDKVLAKIKVNEDKAHEIQSAMDDVITYERCIEFEVSEGKMIDVDTVSCFNTTHYCFGVEDNFSFESVHLTKEDFEELQTQIKHFSVEGELL
ncbi:hypothetical protein [Bacillus thuringiensis]|uniref:hypothetical protein n=1 Tax=Bacillus thuringiensis TaxID=1428 RepID=UPI000A3BC317|nr:hypothetical protein [Bacillus thuringiensis]OTZ47965.1 hypothetical protein BK762_19980 [Bacillus thuringiensis serovar toumanoffi]